MNKLKKRVEINKFDSILDIEVKNEGGFFYSISFKCYQRKDCTMTSTIKFNSVGKQDLLNIAEACKKLALEDWN